LAKRGTSGLGIGRQNGWPIGYGNTGKSFAKKLAGFTEVEVLCYDILPNVGDTYARQVSLEELQQKSTGFESTHS
jgi:D-3-phosphoglycerate dehydrogenase